MFSKYELYTSSGSMYCYPDTNILRNRLDLRDNEALRAAEEDITSIKQYELMQAPITGRFSKTHLCRIHRFLFEDVYAFAGHLRREQIGKADTWFYPPRMIDRELTRICGEVTQSNRYHSADLPLLLDRLAYVMAELNIIHPFREGNGRVIREYIRLLVLDNGYEVNWGDVGRDTLLSASIASVDDYHALIPVLATCTSLIEK